MRESLLKLFKSNAHKGSIVYQAGIWLIASFIALGCCCDGYYHLVPEAHYVEGRETYASSSEMALYMNGLEVLVSGGSVQAPTSKVQAHFLNAGLRITTERSITYNFTDVRVRDALGEIPPVWFDIQRRPAGDTKRTKWKSLLTKEDFENKVKTVALEPGQYSVWYRFTTSNGKDRTGEELVFPIILDLGVITDGDDSLSLSNLRFNAMTGFPEPRSTPDFY